MFLFSDRILFADRPNYDRWKIWTSAGSWREGLSGLKGGESSAAKKYDELDDSFARDAFNAKEYAVIADTELATYTTNDDGSRYENSVVRIVKSSAQPRKETVQKGISNRDIFSVEHLLTTTFLSILPVILFLSLSFWGKTL